MKYGRPGRVRTLIEFSKTFVVSLFASIGLPLLFGTLLDWAVAKNGTGGGNFWFPAHPDEIIFFLCGLLVALPYLVGLLVLGFPTVWLLNNLGIHLSYSLNIPVPNGSLSVVGNTIIAEAIAVGTQLVIWAVAIHLVRAVVKGFVGFLTASHSAA